MKWYLKCLVFLVIFLLLAGVGSIVYFLRARMQGTEYQFQVDAILAAAQVANQGKATTDADKAVIAEYEGKRYVIAPGNYLALSSYVRKDAAMPLIPRLDEKNALRITFCGEAEMLAAPADASGDRVLVRLKSMGQTFHMHIRGGNLWPSLVACCTKGTYHDLNVPLD